MSKSARASKSAAKGRTICAIDIGSSKICCVIARIQPKDDGSLLPGREHAIEVIGFGHVRSQGIKSGLVSDMNLAEDAIRNAVDLAERSAGVTVDQVLMNVSAGRVGSDTFSSSISLGGQDVTRSDIRTVLSAGREHAMSAGRTTLHALAIGYRLDGEAGIDDPLAMVGRELGVDMHVVSADEAPLRNLEGCINRSHLAVETMVATPFASGLATLVQDEAQLGCACIDMGGGATTVSIFLGGKLVFTDAVAVGGSHVTNDIARGLGIGVADAERLKVLHATTDPARASDDETVSVAGVGADSLDHSQVVGMAQLARIAAPRVEETLELVRDRIVQSGFGGAIGRRLVMTGGASQISGCQATATRIFNRDVRLGRPLGVSGLPQNAKGAPFSTVVGLLVYPQHAVHDLAGSASPFASTFSALGLSRVGAWLKASF